MQRAFERVCFHNPYECSFSLIGLLCRFNQLKHYP
uniref:Uncharacterized protein n=1 Tax=Siphoviridae sp. ct3z32 TaxID=2825327 RepID=A0A8S5VHK1_9CAUD|nr:MAG TPA: hypothetical protein [Siphoviridae sp. ct3z32]